MALAVCLLFDRFGDALIRRIWARLEDEGIDTPLTHTHGGHRPHLSLAVLREWDLPRVQTQLASVPRSTPTELSLPATLAFTRGRAALAVAITPQIGERQERVVHAVLAAGADLHHHYVPGRWVPHVSVATGGTLTNLPVVSTVINNHLPISVRADSAALVDSGTGQCWTLPLI